MSSIDERIVSMKFSNSQFEQGIKNTMGSLDALKSKLNLAGATKGLENITSAAKNVSLSGIASDLENISSKFSALGAVGFTVLQTLTQKAMSFGTQALSSILDPLIQGGKQRALTIEQAKFQFAGLGMNVGKTMDSARSAVLGTAYSLADAAKAASMFGASGMTAGPAMVSSLRSIAGVAAMTGSSYQDISNIFTGVAGQGRLMGQDLMQMSSRGINAAATLSKAMGKPESVIRDMVTSGDISFKMFSDAMDGAFGKHAADANMTFAGSLANMRAALSRIGADVATPAYENQRRVLNAMTPVIDNVHKALQPVIRIFAQLGTISSVGVVKMLKNLDLSKLKVMMVSVGQIIRDVAFAVQAFIRPIKQAFQEVFPPSTTKQFQAVFVAIQKFTAGLIMGADTSDKLRRTFVGIFSVFKIGWEVIKGITKLFFSLFSIAGTGSGGILALTAVVGDFISNILKWIKLGGGVSGFFDSLIAAKNNILQPMANLVSGLADAFASLFKGDVSGFKDKLGKAFSSIGDLFNGYRANIASTFSDAVNYLRTIGTVLSGFGSNTLGSLGNLFNILSKSVQNLRDKLLGLVPKIDVSGLNGVGGKLSGFSVVAEHVKNVWDGLVNALSKIGSVLKPITSKIGEFFNVISDKILSYIKGMSFEQGVALLNTGFFIAMYVMLSRFIKSMKGVTDAFKRVLNSISGVFRELTNSLKTMQQNVRANIILKIAIAVGILAAAVYVLSKIPVNDLKTAMAAMSIMFLELGIILVAFSKINTGNSSLAKTSFSLILLAIATDILASAVKKLSGLDWVSLAKGLVGVGGLLVALALFSKFAEANSGGLSSGVGLVLLAVAIKLLVGSVSTLGNMDTGILIKGIVSLGAMLVLLAGIVKAFNDTKGIVRAAVAMLILAGALMALSIALRIYAALDYGTFVKGLGLMAGTLVAIALAMRLMPKGMFIIANSLVVLSVALLMLSGVLKIMGSMSMDEIGKSLLTLAGSLAIITAAVYALGNMKGGAKAAWMMMTLSKSLVILTGVLVVLSRLSWEQIAKGLAALAGTFAILVIAGYALKPVVGTLLIFAGVLKILGLTIILASTGLLLFAVALGMLAVSGAVGFAVLVAGIMSFLPLIPLIAQQVGLGMVAVAKVLGDASPVLLAAFTKTLLAMIKGFVAVTPPAVKAFVTLLSSLIAAVVTIAPQWISAGWTIMTALMKGIADHIQDVVVIGGNIIVGFLNGLTVALPSIIVAGVKFIVALIQGIVSNLPQLIASGVSLIVAWLTGITNNLPQLIAAGAKLIVAFLTGITNSLPSVIASIAALIVAVLTGLANSLPSMIAAGAKLIVALLNGIANALPSILAAVARVIATFLIGIANALPSIIAAGARLIVAFINGIANAIPSIVAAVGNLIVKFLVAVAGQVPKVIAAGVSIIVAFIKGIANSGVTIANAAGDAIITFLTGLSKAIDDHAEEIGTAGAKLGISLASGLIKGLGASMRELAKHSNFVGASVLNKLADALGAHSPSTKTYKFGMSVNQGLSNGLRDYSGIASKQAAGVGHAAIDAMRKSISGMSDIISGPIDINPTVTPVLDLTGVQKGAGLLNSLLPNQQISVGATYSKANAASAGYSANQARTTAPAAKPVGDKTPVAPRPVEFHIGTILDGDSLLRRARANDRMLSLAEGGDSNQIVGLGL